MIRKILHKMTTIFKIYAIEMFIKQNNNQLSFKIGQQFYALSFDSENRFYYVSTHYKHHFVEMPILD